MKYHGLSFEDTFQRDRVKPPQKRLQTDHATSSNGNFPQGNYRKMEKRNTRLYHYKYYIPVGCCKYFTLSIPIRRLHWIPSKGPNDEGTGVFCDGNRCISRRLC